jgi:peroxiredoxin family protein
MKIIVTEGQLSKIINKGILSEGAPTTYDEIINFQTFAKSKGFKNVAGKNIGKLISVDGKWGTNSQSAWNKLYKTYVKPKNVKTKNNNKIKVKTGDTSWLKSTSKQVKNQIWYLMTQGFNQPFTVLDDINSKVYAVNGDYTIYGVYKVITGKDRGDEIKDVTFGDWFFENPLDNTWQFLKDAFTSKKEGIGNKIQDAVSHLDNQYFGTKMWVKKNTPSGIFKSDKSLGNWLESKVMTTFAEKDYGKRFIGFNTLSGKPIAVGFHGTKNPVRINITTDDWSQAVKNKSGNYSFGCVNFKDSDIQNINNFIKNDQYSFWLPDSSTNYLQFKQGEKPSFIRDIIGGLI